MDAHARWTLIYGVVMFVLFVALLIYWIDL